MSLAEQFTDYIFDNGGREALKANSNGHVTQFSPASLRLTSEASRSGDKWVRHLYVAGLPPNPKPRLIKELTSHSSAGIDVSMRIDPIPANRLARSIENEIKETRLSLRNAQTTGDDIKQMSYKDDLKRLLKVKQATDNSEEVVRAGLFVTIRHENYNKCKQASKDIVRRMQQKRVTLKPIHWHAKEALQTTAPIPRNALGPAYQIVMTGSAVGTLFPFTSNTIVEEGGILYGWNCSTGEPVKVDRYARRNGYNMVVTGDIGAGKSYGVSLVDLRMRINDSNLITIIVDPRGAFGEVCEAFGGDRIIVGGDTAFNPLEIVRTPQHVIDEAGDLDPFAQNLDSNMGFFEPFFNRGQDEGLNTIRRTVLREAMGTTYNRAGIFQYSLESHEKPSPVIPDLKEVLREIEQDVEGYLGREETDHTIKQWEQAASYLRMGLEPFRAPDPDSDETGGFYANLSQPSDFKIGESDFIYVDMQQFEQSRDSSIMMKLVWDAIYNRTKLSTSNVHTIVDEFHTILENEGDLDWLENEYRHSRHFNNAITVMSQRSKDFFRQEKAETIVELSSMSLSFKNENMEYKYGEQLGFEKNEVDFVRECHAGDKDRGWSNALLKVGDRRPIPLTVQAMPREERLIDPETYEYRYGNSTGPDYVEEAV